MDDLKVRLDVGGHGSGGEVKDQQVSLAVDGGDGELTAIGAEGQRADPAGEFQGVGHLAPGAEVHDVQGGMLR